MDSGVKCRRLVMEERSVAKSVILILLVSTLISVNATQTESEEPRRCYWCGPLAEQVHRSPRAPACADSDQWSACELGYRYCAVVATAPPYAESRFCVKMYQDECYTAYCNSTNTWKMTCPCRGDLCNGPNSQRETDAFAVISKLVVKIKKRFIQESNEHTSIVSNATENNQLYPQGTKNNSEENPAKDSLIERNIKPTGESKAETENMMHSNEIKGIEDAKVEIHIPVDTKLAPKDEVDKIEMPQVAIEKTTAKIATHEPFKTIITIMNDERQLVSNVKVTEPMPAAESLQQGANSPVEVNPTEATTMETTSTTMTMPMTTDADMPMETTSKPTNGKNLSGKISCNIIDVIFSLVVVKLTV